MSPEDLQRTKRNDQLSEIKSRKWKISWLNQSYGEFETPPKDGASPVKPAIWFDRPLIETPKLSSKNVTNTFLKHVSDNNVQKE